MQMSEDQRPRADRIFPRSVRIYFCTLVMVCAVMSISIHNALYYGDGWWFVIVDAFLLLWLTTKM